MLAKLVDQRRRETFEGAQGRTIVETQHGQMPTIRRRLIHRFAATMVSEIATACEGSGTVGGSCCLVKLERRMAFTH